jgi:hypothetical protein
MSVPDFSIENHTEAETTECLSDGGRSTRLSHDDRLTIQQYLSRTAHFAALTGFGSEHETGLTWEQVHMNAQALYSIVTLRP